MIKNLIATDDPCLWVAVSKFAGFHLCKGVGDIAGFGIFRQKRGADGLFVDAGGQCLDGQSGIAQQRCPDRRGGCQYQALLRHVDNLGGHGVNVRAAFWPGVCG